MALTEEKLFKAFGFEPPAAEPAAQEPASQEPAEGVEPAQVQTSEPGAVSAEPVQPAAEGGEGTTAVNEPMTEAQRSANAERRRKQEQRQQAAIDAAVQEALNKQKAQTDKQLESFFASAGMKNSYTGEAITNLEQFLSYRQKHSEEQLKQGKLTPEALDKAIAEHPVVQQAQQLVQQAHSDAQQRQQEADRATIEAELLSIRKLDPTVQTVQDLLKLPEGQQIEALVRRGYTFEDAHYLATRQRREQEITNKAKEQAMLNARGKDHLGGAGSARGEGAVTVPGNVMALYRKLNPKMSEAEIVAHYNNYKKK